MTWTDEQVALQESTREFVRREVTPHLQEWEDSGEVPPELHLAAAEAGLLGVSFPEEVGGQGGTLLDSVAMQEAFFEAGGSSGLAAALFTGGIALPHMAAHGTPDQIDSFVWHRFVTVTAPRAAIVPLITFCVAQVSAPFV